MAEYVLAEAHGERALAKPLDARYVPVPPPDDEAREAARLNRLAHPGPPSAASADTDVTAASRKPRRSGQIDDEAADADPRHVSNLASEVDRPKDRAQ